MSRQSKRVIEYRKRTKTLIIKSMGGCCQTCGYNKCESALELHHIDPSKKDFTFGKLRASPRQVDLLKNELKKCILLCCLCHREVHANVRKLPDTFAEFDESVFITRKDEITAKAIEKRSIIKIPKDRRKILLTNDEIHTILNEQFGGNKSAMARHYGVSETSIRKRMNGPVA